MRKVLAGLGLLVLLGAGALAYFVIDPFSDESDPSSSRALTGTSCRRLAGLAGQLAEEDPNPAQFLAALGREAAGIRRGTRGIADLIRGGHNRIPGKGFRERYDDGTSGQARHFSGIAVATILATGNPTLWISRHLRHDPKGSADDNLTEQGISFATQVLTGKLAPDETEDWVLGNLCRKAG